jgi:hypothetical protein
VLRQVLLSLFLRPHCCDRQRSAPVGSPHGRRRRCRHRFALALSHHRAPIAGGFGDTTHPAFRVRPQALGFRAPAPPATRAAHSLATRFRSRPSHATRFARGFRHRRLLGRASGTLCAAAVSRSAGVLGQSPPNNSFKPKPLRGSA